MLAKDGIATEKGDSVISQVEKFDGKFFNPKYVSKHFESDKGTMEEYNPRTIGVKQIQHNLEVIDTAYVVERTKNLRNRIAKDTVVVSTDGTSTAKDNDKNVVSKKILSATQRSGDHETIKFDYNRIMKGRSSEI